MYMINRCSMGYTSSVFALTAPGKLILVDADPAGFNERARFQAIEGKTWNNPALAGRYLLVRNDREAACYEVKIKGG